MSRSFLLLVCVGVMLTATMSSALATTIISRTPEELAQQSALVVDGTVRAVRSYWNDDRSKIFTEATVAVEGTHKGRGGSQVRILQLGGVVGNVRMTAHGALAWRPGEEVLLFLESSGSEAWQVAGFSQGKYEIERDSRTGQAFVRQAMPADSKAGGPAAAQGSTSAATERVALAQFLNRVLPQR